MVRDPDGTVDAPRYHCLVYIIYIIERKNEGAVAATDAAVASTTDAVQVFGGTGYMVETGIEKLMRDAKYCQLFPEPNWVAHDELMRSERGDRTAMRARLT